jgi:FlaG/FlaF family flagellin (archaellin)
MKTIRKCLNDKKGIDTILAALLMVVIVVVAAVMVYAWSTGLLGTLLVHPTTGQESLNYVTNSGAFSNSTSVTAYINNLGTANATLATYYVKDSNGNSYQYSYSTAGAPTIAPNKSVPLTFKIGVAGSGGSCTGCTLTGSAFTFTSGYSYTVLMITSRNNQFTFSVTR